MKMSTTKREVYYFHDCAGIYIICCVLLESQKSCGDHLFCEYTPINTKGSS